MSLLNIENIEKEYRGKRVLDGFSMIANNEIVFLAGRNGAGKTTLIRLALDLDKDYSGKITYDGEPFNNKRKKISVVFDEPKLYKNFSGMDNIKIFSGKKNDEFNSIIKNLQLDDNLLYKKVSSYSLGQRHRLAVAIALLQKPSFLFLDEPTIGLDPISWDLVKKCLLNLKNSQVVVVVTGQDYKEMEEIADSIVILDNAKTVYEGAINDLIEMFPCSLYVESYKNLDSENCVSIESSESGRKKYLYQIMQEDISEFINKLKCQDYDLRLLEIRKKSLEEAFFEMIGGTKNA